MNKFSEEPSSDARTNVRTPTQGRKLFVEAASRLETAFLQRRPFEKGAKKFAIKL